LDGPFNSRVPDGAASSSERLHNWAPGALSTQDSGPISSEQSTSRPLSETDHTVSSNKRSVNKTRARFGLSFKRILSKKDEKSSWLYHGLNYREYLKPVSLSNERRIHRQTKNICFLWQKQKQRKTWSNLLTVDLSCMRTIKLRDYYFTFRTQ